MESIGLIAGNGWASGINLYGVVLLLGVFGRMDVAQVPEVLQHPATLAVAGTFYVLEFVADKIPYVDNLWDGVHTVIRPLGAAAVGYLLADTIGVNELLSAGGSGALALASHSAKATSRAAINASPEPASNIVVSIAEDGLVAAVVWFALEHPVWAAVLVAVLLVVGGVLMVVAFRTARGIARRVRERFEAARAR